jgi:hypothetical protein
VGHVDYGSNAIALTLLQKALTDFDKSDCNKAFGEVAAKIGLIEYYII